MRLSSLPCSSGQTITKFAILRNKKLPSLRNLKTWRIDFCNKSCGSTMEKWGWKPQHGETQNVLISRVRGFGGCLTSSFAIWDSFQFHKSSCCAPTPFTNVMKQFAHLTEAKIPKKKNVEAKIFSRKPPGNVHDIIESHSVAFDHMDNCCEFSEWRLDSCYWWWSCLCTGRTSWLRASILALFED